MCESSSEDNFNIENHINSIEAIEEDPTNDSITNDPSRLWHCATKLDNGCKKSSGERFFFLLYKQRNVTEQKEIIRIEILFMDLHHCFKTCGNAKSKESKYKKQ